MSGWELEYAPPEPDQVPPAFSDSDWDVGDVGDVFSVDMGEFAGITTSTDGGDESLEQKSGGFFSSSSSSEDPFSESDEAIDEASIGGGSGGSFDWSFQCDSDGMDGTLLDGHGSSLVGSPCDGNAGFDSAAVPDGKRSTAKEVEKLRSQVKLLVQQVQEYKAQAQARSFGEQSKGQQSIPFDSRRPSQVAAVKDHMVDTGMLPVTTVVHGRSGSSKATVTTSHSSNASNDGDNFLVAFRAEAAQGYGPLEAGGTMISHSNAPMAVAVSLPERDMSGLPGDLSLSCVFCGSRADRPPLPNDEFEDARTRKRRRVKGAGRKEHKLARWWRGYGYAGGPYCQRCSEVFRDHLIRQKSNSANCTREEPCMDCAKILEHFPAPHREVWARIEAKKEKKEAKRLRQQGQLAIAQSQHSETTGPSENSMLASIAGQPAQKRRAVLAATKEASPMRSAGSVVLACATCLVTYFVVMLSRSAGVSWDSDMRCPAGFWLPIDSQSSSPGRSSCRRCSVCGDELFAQCQSTANTKCIGWSRVHPSDTHSLGVDSSTRDSVGGSAVYEPRAKEFGAHPSQRADAVLWPSTTMKMIYLFGGRSEQGDEGDTWRLLPDEDRWQRIVVKQEPAARSGAMLWNEQDFDQILLFGGQNRDAVGFDDLWSFDNRLATWAYIGGRASPPRSTFLQSETHNPNILAQEDFFASCIERRWPPGRAFGTISAPLLNDGNFGLDGSGRYGYMFGGVIGLEVQTRLQNGSISSYHRFRQNPYRLSDLWKFELTDSARARSPVHAAANVTWTFVKPHDYKTRLMNQGGLIRKSAECGYLCLHVENQQTQRERDGSLLETSQFPVGNGPGARYRHAAWATQRRRLYDPECTSGTCKTVYSPDVEMPRCSFNGMPNAPPFECGGIRAEAECNALTNCIYVVPETFKPVSGALKYQIQHVLYVFGGLGGTDPLVELSDLWRMTRMQASDNEIRVGLQSDDNFGPPRWTYLAGNLEVAPRNGAVPAPLAIASEFLPHAAGGPRYGRRSIADPRSVWYELPAMHDRSVGMFSGIDKSFWEVIRSHHPNMSVENKSQPAAGYWPLPRHSVVSWLEPQHGKDSLYIYGGQTAAHFVPEEPEFTDRGPAVSTFLGDLWRIDVGMILGQSSDDTKSTQPCNSVGYRVCNVTATFISGRNPSGRSRRSVNAGGGSSSSSSNSMPPARAFAASATLSADIGMSSAEVIVFGGATSSGLMSDSIRRDVGARWIDHGSFPRRATAGARALLDAAYAAAYADYKIVREHLACQEKVVYTETENVAKRCSATALKLRMLMEQAKQSIDQIIAHAKGQAWLVTRTREAIDTDAWGWHGAAVTDYKCALEASVVRTMLLDHGFGPMLRRYKLLDLGFGHDGANGTAGGGDEAEADVLPRTIQRAISDFGGVAAFTTPLWAITALVDDGEPNWIFPWAQTQAFIRTTPLGSQFLARNNGSRLPQPIDDDEARTLAGELASGWEPRDWLAIKEALEAEAAESAAYTRIYDEPIIPKIYADEVFNVPEKTEEASVSTIIANDTNRAQNTGGRSSKNVDEAGSVASEHNQTFLEPRHFFGFFAEWLSKTNNVSLNILTIIGSLESRQMMMTFGESD